MQLGTTAIRVILASDDDALSLALQPAFEEARYDVVRLRTRSAISTAMTHDPPALVLLDIGLDDARGFDFCRELKRQPGTQSVPLVILSARNSDEDRIKAFELGAEDFLVPPFNLRELIPRIAVILRRPPPFSRSEPVSPRLKVGPVELDVDGARAFSEGREIQLARLECAVLAYLIAADGRVCKREELLKELWPRDSGPRTVDTHVVRLRRKLGVAGHVIEAVRQAGYRIRTGPLSMAELSLLADEATRRSQARRKKQVSKQRAAWRSRQAQRSPSG